MVIESELAAAYGWSRDQLDPLPYLDVFAHIGEARRREAAKYTWQINIAALPHAQSPRKAHSQLKQQLRQLEINPFDDRPSVYDTVDDATRVLMLGSAIAVMGDDWLGRHPMQASWIRGQGLSPQECVRRHAEWLGQQRAAVAWRPIKQRDTTAERKARRRKRER